MPFWLAALFLCLAAALRADSRNQNFDDFVTPMPVPRGHVLVLGIVGGWERWDHPNRCVRRTALWLQSQEIPGVHVETVENHKLDLAYELVRRVFDFNGDGALAENEARQARVVVFGQSLGGRATLWFCRRMHEWGIPVELALLIDAFGPDDYTVPPNVRTVANVFQREHIIVKGASAVHPVDPTKTRILFNRQLSFKGRDLDISDRPWRQRAFLAAHVKVEYDTELWRELQEVIANAARTARQRAVD